MNTRKNDIDSSSEEYIQSVHDHFFRESMQYIEIGYGIAKIALSLSILNCIDWDTLEIAKGDWIDKKLKEHRSDVLYHAKLLGNGQVVNFLFEHKSNADKRTHKKLLRYILESWDLQEQQEPSIELLPVVISIIVYHGNSPWKIANSIKPLIAIIKEAEDFVPDFRTIVLDLSILDPDRIADSRLKMFLLAIKYSRTSDVLRVLSQIIQISEKINDSGSDDDYLKVVLVYLGSVIKGGAREKFWRIIAQVHRGGEVYMETIADVLRKEERLKRKKIERELLEKIAHKNIEIEQKDKEIKKKSTEISQKDTEIKDKEKTLCEIVSNMLKKNMNIQLIQEITGLSKERIEKIKNDNKS